MKQRHLFSLMLVILMTIPFSGWAQALFDPKKTIYEPSHLFPIVTESEIIGAPDAALQTSVIKQINDRCLSKVIPRFTPDAQQYYCTCTAAATQGNITVSELKTLQKEDNRKLGNKTFEKYVSTVMKPCLESPIEDAEYLICITRRKTDWRIRFPVPYCRCTSSQMQDYFKKNGEMDLLISWGSNKKGRYKDPIASLWGNEIFQRARSAARNDCVGGYMDQGYLKD